MKKVLLNLTRSAAICVFVSPTAFSQEEHTLITTPQLKISYVEGSCDVESGKLPYQFAFLKLQNLTNAAMHVGFNIVVQYDEGCSGCNGNDESLYYLSLSPNQVYEAGCGADDKSKIYLRNPNFSGAWNFQQLRIENVIVE